MPFLFTSYQVIQSQRSLSLIDDFITLARIALLGSYRILLARKSSEEAESLYSFDRNKELLSQPEMFTFIFNQALDTLTAPRILKFK